MKFKKISAMFLGCVMAMTVTSCGSSSPSTGASASADASATAATKSSGTILIGEIGPITGATAKYGIAANNGAQLALDSFGQINGKDVKFDQIDNGGSAPDSVNAYNKMVSNDGVVAIIGAITSGNTAAIAQASQAKGTPIITPTATEESITATGPNIFRSCYLDPYQGKIMADFAVSDKLNAKTAAILTNNGNAYSQGLSDAFEKEFIAKGGKVVDKEGYSDTDVDYKTQLGKIQTQSPDVLFIPDYVDKVALISKQVKDTGLKVTMLGGDGWGGIFASVSDPSVLDGSYICTGFSANDTDPTVQAFIKAYTAKYGSVPDSFAASGYDAAMVMLTAVKAADDAGAINNKNIIDALNKTNVVCSSGTITFDANRNAIKGAIISKLQDGKSTIIQKFDGVQ